MELENKGDLIVKSRTKIAYLLKMFPRFSETFILNEILELERQGLSLHLFSLRYPNEPFRQGKVTNVKTEVTYVFSKRKIPPFSWVKRIKTLWPVLKANFQICKKDPQKYVQVLKVCYSDEKISETFLNLLPERLTHAPLFLMAFLFFRISLFSRTFLSVRTRKGRKARRRFIAAAYIAKILSEEEIGHLHAHFANDPTTVARYVHLLTGIPFSFTAHAKDIYLSKDHDLRNKIQAAKFVITCTNYNKKYLEDISKNRTHIYTIRHGVDRNIFPNVVNGRDYPVEGKANPKRLPVILSVGRLVEKKGFDCLIEACGRLQDWGVQFRCQIIGQGPLESELEKMIHHLKLENKIQTLKFLPHEELVNRYTQSDVFALACRVAENGDRDGIPNVLVEAMAVGLPVVATQESGIAELVESSINGLLVPPRNPSALAEALQKILLRPEAYRSFSQRGKEKVKREFDLSLNVSHLINLLEAG